MHWKVEGREVLCFVLLTSFSRMLYFREGLFFFRSFCRTPIIKVCEEKTNKIQASIAIRASVFPTFFFFCSILAEFYARVFYTLLRGLSYFISFIVLYWTCESVVLFDLYQFLLRSLSYMGWTNIVFKFLKWNKILFRSQSL